MFDLAKRYVYSCDYCGKILEKKEMVNHGGRYVGVDGNLMISISISEEGVYNRAGRRQRTILLCQQCWAKVFRAVRHALNAMMDGEFEDEKQEVGNE